MDHDRSYKLIFSHPEMVEDLLRGFVHEDWVRALDFATLERVGGGYVTDDLREREDDIVWRVRFGQDWLYVYLLLEFQSSVDRFMAVRMLGYLALLYQDLIRGGQLTADRRLPPVLPVVLYNGKPRWNAAEDIAELIVEAPGGLERYRPRLRYLLLDEGRYADGELSALRNLAAALFRLENSRAPQDVERVLATLAEWLQAPAQASLRRAFTVWLKRVFLPGRMPGVDFETLNDLHEVRSMLAERVIEWTEEWKQQGLEAGWQKGLQEGRQAGLQEGLQEGRQAGLQEGLQEGLQKGQQEGEAALLSRLLERRFGAVDETLRRRVHSADADTLLRWADRLLSAASAEEVLRD